MLHSPVQWLRLAEHSEAWAGAGSCNAICLWQQRSLTLFLQADSLHIPLCLCSHKDPGFEVPPTLSLHFALIVIYILSPPSLSVPMYLFSISVIFPYLTDPDSPVHPPKTQS